MSDTPSATESDLSEETRRRYVEALETLPPLTRAVFLLKGLDDLSYDDIGGRCGITVDEVTVRMTDALIGVDRYMEANRYWPPAFDGHVCRCATRGRGHA